MKSTLFLIALLFYSSTTFSQNHYIYKGDKKYLSTRTWDFVGLNDDMPSVTIAKTSFGGYLMLELSVFDKNEYIIGTVYVFLEDGSIIKCSDKGVRDHVDGKSINVFNFTNSEMNRLKSTRITSIRYSKKHFENRNSYTAQNKTHFYQNELKDYYETNVEISSLYTYSKNTTITYTSEEPFSSCNYSDGYIGCSFLNIMSTSELKDKNVIKEFNRDNTTIINAFYLNKWGVHIKLKDGIVIHSRISLENDANIDVYKQKLNKDYIKVEDNKWVHSRNKYIKINLTYYNNNLAIEYTNTLIKRF